jgi:DNA-binding response OmpR family regulator
VTRVLVIDDDAHIRELMQRILSGAGYLVACAVDGNDGVRTFDEFRPDLVITDIIMPDKEGLETIRELRSRDPAVPIIAVSGGGRVGTLDVLSIAEKFGANRILAKPFTLSTLLNLVREALAPRNERLAVVGAESLRVRR